MPWQDFALAATTVVFFLSLFPSMADPRTRISRRTSVPTAAAVWAQAITFATLGFLYTSLGSVLIASAWTFLAWRRPLHSSAPQ